MFVQKFLRIFLKIFSRISRFGLVTQENSVYILGGYCDGRATSRIAKFAINAWTDIGHLETARYGHRAIENSGRVYVVGGYNAYLYVIF